MEPGQPCVSTTGMASELADRTCSRCTRCPAAVVTNDPQLFNSASVRRQSYPPIQRSITERRNFCSVP